MPPFQQLNLRKNAVVPDSQSAGSLASTRILPLKLLFAQPSMQASSNSDGGRCYGWLINQAKQNKAKQNEAPDCWQEKHNHPTVSENLCLSEGGAILISSKCYCISSILSSLIIFTKTHCFQWCHSWPTQTHSPSLKKGCIHVIMMKPSMKPKDYKSRLDFLLKRCWRFPAFSPHLSTLTNGISISVFHQPSKV